MLSLWLPRDKWLWVCWILQFCSFGWLPAALPVPVVPGNHCIEICINVDARDLGDQAPVWFLGIARYLCKYLTYKMSSTSNLATKWYFEYCSIYFIGKTNLSITLRFGFWDIDRASLIKTWRQLAYNNNNPIWNLQHFSWF